MSKQLLILLLFALLAATPGCKEDEETHDIRKWNVTLGKEDKKPYGTYLAYESLKYYFPDARIEPLSQSFKYTNMGDQMKSGEGGHSLLVLQGLNFRLDDYEWKQLKEFIENGNEVILFTSYIDDRIEEDLDCYKLGGNEENFGYFGDSTELDNKNVLAMATDRTKRYGYTGRSLKGYFNIAEEAHSKKKKNKLHSSSDTDSVPPPENNSSSDNNSGDSGDRPSYEAGTNYIGPDTLGYMYNSPNFVRYQIGEGHITLHAAPLVLSNYFLLQPGNLDYLTSVWQTIPQNINRVYWCDYYKRSVEVSSWGILWRYPATRMAVILGLSLLLIYILFEGKRKQRVIPVIKPLKNESVSFVETVGRLYYNKGDHRNLADKMSMQFLEWVRTHYFLNTNVIDENFVRQLTIKSGLSEAIVSELVGMIVEVRRYEINPNDAYLYQLYRTIQLFYKNNRT